LISFLWPAKIHEIRIRTGYHNKLITANK